MNRFSARAERLLRQGGWNPDRPSNFPSIAYELEFRFGFEVFETAKAFLSEFAGVTIQVPRGELASNVEFDPRASLASGAFEDVRGASEDVEWLEECTGERVYPIGRIGRSTLLFMTPSGRVQSLDDLWLWWGDIGETPDAAIEALCAETFQLRGRGLS